MLSRFRKVSPILYRSSAPTPEDVIWLNKKLGIKRIISLDETAGKKINLSCELLEIDHINLFIDVGRKFTILKFLEEIGNLLKGKEKTLVHCHWGKDRTGLAVAMYRCQEQGWSADKAIEEAKSLNFGLGLDPKITELYISLIKDSEKTTDNNDNMDGAIDENFDDHFGTGTAEGLSWSPYADRYVKEYPISGMYLNEGEGNPLGGFGPSIVGGGTVL